MSTDAALLDKIADKLDSSSFTLLLANKQFPIDSLKIHKTTTPVTRRTLRGGVYVADVEADRVIARLTDKSVVPLISTAMLGPNTEFADIRILINDAQGFQACIHANLTNSMESASFVELGLTITRTD